MMIGLGPNVDFFTFEELKRLAQTFKEQEKDKTLNP